jgi:hypothetical protein
MKLVDFNAQLKELYGRDGQPTEKGRQMIADFEAARIERNKDIADLIDSRGRLTLRGHARLRDIENLLYSVRRGHLDNTGADCRVDLDGHDCCYVCNQAEDMLRATAQYYEEAK